LKKFFAIVIQFDKTSKKESKLNIVKFDQKPKVIAEKVIEIKKGRWYDLKIMILKDKL